MSFKFVDKTSNNTDFNDTELKDCLGLGVKTWSEGGSSTEGIKGIVHNDAVIAENDNRALSSLLSNDLNLMFNLDRTVYVSKKGVVGGMKRLETALTSTPAIKHFHTITEAVDYLLALTDATAPVIEVTSGVTTLKTQNLWSSNNKPTLSNSGCTIIVGPGSYTGETVFASMSGIDLLSKIHIIGMGEVFINTINWGYSGGSTAQFGLTFENIEFGVVTGVLDIDTRFWNCIIRQSFARSLFSTALSKFKGDLYFLDNARVNFSGTNSMTVQTATGFEFWVNNTNIASLGT